MVQLSLPLPHYWSNDKRLICEQQPIIPFSHRTQSIWSVGRESFFFSRNTRIYDIFYAEQMAPYSIIVVDSRSARGRQDGRVRYLLRFNSVLPELSAGCWHFEKGLSGASVVCFQSGAKCVFTLISTKHFPATIKWKRHFNLKLSKCITAQFSNLSTN